MRFFGWSESALAQKPSNGYGYFPQGTSKSLAFQENCNESLQATVRKEIAAD
jgi:hypothetical protein